MHHNPYICCQFFEGFWNSDLHDLRLGFLPDPILDRFYLLKRHIETPHVSDHPMKNFDQYRDKIGTWDEEHQKDFQVDEYDDQIFFSQRPLARFRNSKNRSAWHPKLASRNRIAISRYVEPDI